MPQLPTTSVVTPIISVLSAPRLASRLQSEWEWQSMNPGATILPLASISHAACAPSRLPTAATRSPSIPTSARTHGAPVPSTTLPPRITKSSMIVALSNEVSCAGPAYHGRAERFLCRPDRFPCHPERFPCHPAPPPVIPSGARDQLQ